MKQNKKLLIILAVLIMLLAGVVVWYFVLRKKDASPIALPEDNSGDGSGSSGVLSYGSRGDDVKRLQAFLNSQLALLIWRDKPVCDGVEIKSLVEDGIFGKKTKAAVEWYFNSSTVNVNQF